MCGSEIQGASVGRKDGKGLVERIGRERGSDDELVVGDIIDLYVRSLVKNLDAVGMATVEDLPRGVGAVSYVTARRMPIGIDTEAKGFVSLGIIGGETSLVEQQGGTMRSTDVQTHARRVATIEAVAIDATLELRILDERCLLEGGEVALVDAHLAPHFVAWLDETIAQAVVDAVGAHIKVEWLVSMPTIGKLGRNGDIE